MASVGDDRTPRAHKRPLLGLVLPGAMAGLLLSIGVASAQEKFPDPALLEKLGILVTQKGLDPNNRLDTRPCPGEKRLLTFLRELPPDQDAIARELEALGTSCRKEGTRLDCFYERHVHSDAWAWGHDGPVGSGDETYRITFTVTKQGDELQYGIDYHLLADPK